MSLQRTLLRDVAQAYLRAIERFETAISVDRRDDALSEMQMIERCVTVKENSVEWRRPARAGGRR